MGFSIQAQERSGHVHHMGSVTHWVGVHFSFLQNSHDTYRFNIVKTGINRFLFMGGSTVTG